jgi:outer membrane protein OmpA-like peptidoglycan-associated protein
VARIKAVEPVGYADFTGSPTHNDRLSINRARTVYEFLRQGGSQLDSVLLDPRGVGESEAVATHRDDRRGRRRDRRVDVFVTYKKG